MNFCLRSLFLQKNKRERKETTIHEYGQDTFNTHVSFYQEKNLFIGFCSRYITFYFILFYLNNQFKAYKGWFAPELLYSQTLPSSPTTTKSSPSDPMTTSRANQVQYHPAIYTILFTGDCLHTGEKDTGGLRMYSFIHICAPWSDSK